MCFAQRAKARLSTARYRMQELSDFNWDTTFSRLFARCLDRYKDGDTDYSRYFGKEDLAFLFSIGYKPREFFDFVEDFADEGVPAPTSAALVASVRRDYFAVIQKGQLSDREVANDDLPGREEELGGFVWLPRILVKARAKLRGELHPDTMYSCGGDRAFLRRHDIHPADFLRIVWAAGDNDAAVAEYVKARSPQTEAPS